MMKQAKNIVGSGRKGTGNDLALGARRDWRRGGDAVIDPARFARSGGATGRDDAALEEFFSGGGAHDVLIAGDASDALLLLV